MDYISLHAIAKQLNLSCGDLVETICKCLGIKTYVIPRNKSQIHTVICMTDLNKIYEFLKQHPDKKERTDYLRRESRIRNFGSWENWKKSMTEKLKQTCLKRYGVDNVFKNVQIQEKVKQTNLKKYGTENIFASEYGKEKIKETMLQRYGVENSRYLLETKQKAEQTCLKKYGVKHYSQTKKFQEQRYKHFYYDNTYFDSSWELAVWIYCKDNNIDIEREPCSFTYSYNNERHTYYPDFRINDKLVEIKGDHLLKQLQTDKDCLESAKYKCMCDNNVEIWSKKEIQDYLNYIDEKYGCKIYNEAAIVKDQINKYVTDNFIKKAKELFGNVYDYSKTQCVNSDDKVVIICPKHGEFKLRSSHHLEGQGCPKCSRLGNKGLTKEQRDIRNRHIKLALECGMAIPDAVIVFNLSLPLIVKLCNNKK